MLRSLLDSHFGLKIQDLKNVKKHDLNLNELYRQTIANKRETFEILKGILYQKSKHKGFFKLCIPSTLATAIILKIHNKGSFHFSKNDTARQF